jgi:hypothetical protein
MPVKCPT